MDPNLIYAKTPTGDEAVRQSTRVVQRNLRMVLVLVDGKVSVTELSAKIGNPRLVETALRELEEGGFIAPTIEAVSVWEESLKAAQDEPSQSATSALSEFSTFGPKSIGAANSWATQSAASNFSSFGKPILPTTNRATATANAPERVSPRSPDPDHHGETPWFLRLRPVMLSSAAILVTLVATALFYPYEQFKPDLEATASQLVDAPVRIDGVALALFPSPHLKLTGVQLGSPVDGKITEIRVSSPISILGGAPHKISRIDISGASLAANRLVSLPMFRGERFGDGSIEVSRIQVEKSQISLGEQLALRDLYGKVEFRSDGKIEKAVFETADRSLLVEATPSATGIGLSIEGRAWKPAGSSIVFASLQAKGLLQKEKLLVENIDTTFLGGLLRGNWLLDWSNGLSMAGDGSLIRLDSRKVSEEFAPSLKIEGDMTGTVRLRSVGRDWETLWTNAEAMLTTEITRGVLHGVDLGEAARRAGGSEVQAGSTKFDRLRSTISITPKQVVGREVHMDAGMVTANGHFVGERAGQVEGTMAVTLQTSVSSQRAAVHVFGVLPNLTAAANK
jgi:hypothetical protein